MTSGRRISDIARSTGIGIQTTTKTMENKTIDNLIGCSLNCEGINRSKDVINNFLMDNACDILCLQETWTIDFNILGNIHNDFLFTGISGVDHTVEILQGRPKGGVHFIQKNHISCYIKHIKLSHRRTCVISITIDNVSCLILSVYMPCDSYLVNNVNSEFVDCIDNIENVLNVLHSYDFNHIIITGDFNTSFSRDNAQSKCLSEFLVRNNLFVSWEHPSDKGGNSYNNLSLGHHSFIDHFCQ